MYAQSRSADNSFYKSVLSYISTCKQIICDYQIISFHMRSGYVLSFSAENSWSFLIEVL